MPYDTGLANRLRAQGLRVVECSGWQSRANSSGSSFYPRGAVTHHTAGPAPGGAVAPSLGTVINGRSDLPGPLCNTYIDFEGTVYVVAAGGANHAGTPDGGSCKGMTGNSSAWGLEIEHPGTYPLPDKIAEVAAAVQAATIKGTAGAGMVVYHKEWAPSRKIDLATTPSPDAHRSRVGYYLTHPYKKQAQQQPAQPFELQLPIAALAAITIEEGAMPPEFTIQDTSKGNDGSGSVYGFFASGLVRRLTGKERDAWHVGGPDGPRELESVFDDENSNRLHQYDQALRGMVKERK